MRDTLGYLSACGLVLVAVLPLYFAWAVSGHDSRLLVAGFLVGVFDALVLPRLWRRLSPQ